MNSWPKKLTGDEEEDAGSEGLVKAVEGGVVDECHDADDDANETGQQGEDHEGPGGVPVGCGGDSRGAWVLTDRTEFTLQRCSCLFTCAPPVLFDLLSKFDWRRWRVSCFSSAPACHLVFGDGFASHCVSHPLPKMYIIYTLKSLRLVPSILYWCSNALYLSYWSIATWDWYYVDVLRSWLLFIWLHSSREGGSPSVCKGWVPRSWTGCQQANKYKWGSS